MTTHSSARQDILTGIRRALRDADTSPVHVPRGYRHTGHPDTGHRDTDPDGRRLTELFAERVADYRAVVVRCRPDEVEARIADALPDRARVLVPDGLPWQVPDHHTDTRLTALELDTIDAVVTGASLGIAQTGTIVLSHGPGQGRRALTLIPDLHVCVIRADQIVADVPDALPQLDPDQPTTWISGPSATSDIELHRVEGVHGPRNLHVIVTG